MAETFEELLESLLTQRKDNPALYKNKVVGHVPDAAMGGKSANGRAMPLSTSVNSYLGGLVRGVPKKPYSKVVVVKVFG